MLSNVYAPKLKDFSLYATMFSGHFSSCELYKGLDLPSIEIIEKAFFYNPITTPSAQMHNYATKLELSNVEEIRSLPQGFCKADYGSVILVLPSTLKICEPDYFDEVESDWYIVYATKGTYAEQWAIENGFNFIDISEENKEAAIITDLPEHYYSYMRPLEADVAGFNRTYQWYGSDLADSTTGTPIDGATEKKFNPNEYKQYKYYYCVVTSTDIGYEPIEIRTGVTENKSYVASQEPEKEPADYTALDEALSEIPEDLTIYTEESVANLKAVEESIDRNLDITNQEKISEYVEAIRKAIDALEVKPADYSELKKALATVPSDLSIYTEESVFALQEVIDSIDYSLDITQQEKVDEYVKQIDNAVSNLKKECWFIRFIKAIISFFNRILMNIKLLFD